MGDGSLNLCSTRARTRLLISFTRRSFPLTHLLVSFMRRYFPPDKDTRLQRPAAVLVHGGSFISGNAGSDQEPTLAYELVTRGCVRLPDAFHYLMSCTWPNWRDAAHHCPLTAYLCLPSVILSLRALPHADTWLCLSTTVLMESSAIRPTPQPRTLSRTPGRPFGLCG